MNRHLRLFLVGIIGLLLIGTVSADGPKPPEKPADIDIAVTPGAISAGGKAAITVRLTPISGVKINRYPMIKLEVFEQDGLVAGPAEAKIGNSKPPAPDEMEKNYYKTVDPIQIEVDVAPTASAGKHSAQAKLTYFYCVTASGFCAPKRVPIEIPLVVAN